MLLVVHLLLLCLVLLVDDEQPTLDHCLRRRLAFVQAVQRRRPDQLDSKMSLSLVQLLHRSTVACWLLGGVHVGVGKRMRAWLAVGEDRRLARGIEAELAGMGNRTLPTRVAVLLAQVARPRVLEDGGIFLLLLFVFGVEVL